MSSIGDFDPIYEGCGYQQSLCDCMEPVLLAIQTAIQTISINIEKQSEPTCDIIDKCFDKIVSRFRDRFETTGRTCSECQQMARNGMRGTLEYAFQCAGACIEETQKVCSAGDPSTWGKPCQGCGKEPCCCNKGICEPCEDDTDKKPKYIAWCNPTNQTVQVTKSDAGRLPPPWYQVGLAETEIAAIALAEANCKKPPDTVIIAPATPTELNQYGPIPCRFNWYQQGKSPLSHPTRYSIIHKLGAYTQNLLATGELGVGGVNLENVGEVIASSVRWFSESPPYIAANILPDIVNAFGCDSPVFKDSISVLTEFQFLNKAMGIDLGDWALPWRYAASLACPTKFLDPDKAFAAYLGHGITREDAVTLWKMQGICPENFDWYERAARSKPIPLQLVSMRRRNLIDDTQFNEGMRQLGYLEQPVVDALFKITEQVPTLTDIMRLMVRDADDETPDGPVKQFNLDYAFEQKYGGKLREWSEFQGIPEDVARYTWRAHWTIPPPTALFEFWHRLRKNKDYPDLEKNIKAALIQQDILPFWHRHYLAVSFNPMGRVDIRRAYNIGTLTDDEVKDAYTQLGYSDETVDRLFKFSERLRDKSIASLPPVKRWVAFLIDKQSCINELRGDGFPQGAIDKALLQAEAGFQTAEVSKAFIRGDMPRQELLNRLTAQGCSQGGAVKIADKLSTRVRNNPALKGFAVGALSRNDAQTEATTYGMNGTVVDTLLNAIDRETEYALLARCQNGIKQRFLAGELTKGEALAEIKNRGTVDPRADQLADEWDCEKSAIGRAIPTSQLCTMLEQGAITSNDFRNRLLNIGYTKASADLLTENCLIAIGEKRRKLAEREQKNLLRQEQQAARLAARLSAAANRAANQLASAQKQAALARQRREKQVIIAAEKLHKKCDCDLYAAIGAARTARDYVIKTYGLTIDETLAILIKAAEAMDQGDLQGYADAVDAFAVEAAATPINGSTNGQA